MFSEQGAKNHGSYKDFLNKWGNGTTELYNSAISAPMAKGDITASVARGKAEELKNDLARILQTDLQESERNELTREFRDVTSYLEGINHGLLLASELLNSSIR